VIFLLRACSKTVTHENISEIENGPFKVMVRTREYNNSGSDIVDICVVETGNHKFPDQPDKTSQCFLNGYDFGALTVKWLDPEVIEVSFHTGLVAHFSNSAVVNREGALPQRFHMVLCDGCGLEQKYPLPGYPNPRQ
jgi:hypothetical protein